MSLHWRLLSVILLVAVATALIIIFAPPSPGVANPPVSLPAAAAPAAAAPAAAAPAPVARAAGHRQPGADLDARIAGQQQLVAELERIADLVPARYRLIVVEAAQANSLEPRTLAALGWVESRWQAGAAGADGEVGLMQIMPATAVWIAGEMGLSEYDLADPATNVAMGAFYLRRLMNAEGSVEKALAQYNAGPRWRERAPTVARAYAARVRATEQKGQ